MGLLALPLWTMEVVMKSPVAIVLTAVLIATITPSADANQPIELPKFVRQWFSGQKFSGNREMRGDYFQCRINGADFEGMVISNAKFDQCDLSNANMKGVRFAKDVQLRRATMNEADLVGADFVGAVVDSVNFRGADLRKAKNFKAIKKSNFQRADLRGADFSKVPMPMIGMEWDDAIYDSSTKFPAGFDPDKAGLKKIK
jgi:uncharacterized protein YjbI with pentapeptide repeats